MNLHISLNIEVTSKVYLCLDATLGCSTLLSQRGKKNHHFKLSFVKLAKVKADKKNNSKNKKDFKQLIEKLVQKFCSLGHTPCLKEP